MTAVRVSYDTVVKGMVRRTKELEDLLNKSTKVERAVRGKATDLEADKDKLIRAATEYVNSLSSEEDEEKIEKVYEEQPELLDRIDQALEKAREYLSEEDHKMKILEKAAEVKDTDKVIERALNTIEKKVKVYDDTSIAMLRSVHDALGDISSG